MRIRAFLWIVSVSCMLLACQGQSRDSLMAKGKELADQGNFKGAIVVYKNLLEKYPGDLPASIALTGAYLRSGKTEQAAAELANVTRLAPDAPEGILLTARVRNAENKPDLALEALQALLAAPSAPAEAWELAGVALSLKGRFDQARDRYEKALALSGDLATARLGLAECLIQQKLPDQARSQLDELLRTAPRDRAALYMLLQLQLQNDDEDGILDTYTKLAQYYPSDMRARYGEAFMRLGKKNDLAFAQATADDLLKNYGKAPEGHKLKGLLLLSRGENTQAVNTLLQAHKLRQDIDTNIFLAQAYANLGNLETATSHLQAVLSREPGLTAPRRMLAAIQIRQGRLDEAIAETQKILEKSPSDDLGERLLGDALVAKREFDKGLEVFSRLAESGGQSPVVHLKKGLLLAIKGDDGTAEQELRKAVDLAGRQLEPRLYLSAFLASKNRVDEAIAILGEGQDSGAEAALARNAMAKLRLRQGRLDQSRELLEEARRLDPSVLNTYYNLAALHISGGDLQKATADYDAALAVKADDPRALSGAAACREAMGDLAGARALLERAAKNQSPRASLELAQFLVRRADNDAALAVLEKALSSNPDMIPAWLLKCRLLAASGAQDKAMDALDRLETLNQRTGLLEKAKYHLSRKDPDKALEMAAKLRAINPRSGDYHLPLAEIQQIGGQLPAARETLREALRADPGNAKVLAASADIENRMGNVPGALDLMDKAMAAGMEPAAGHAVKGAILQQAGDAKAAAEQYEKALRLKEDQPLALNNLAMLYADRQGDEAKALELALRACALQPGNPMLLDTLGYVLVKNGRPGDGLKVLERALKLQPGNPDIEKHRDMAREMAPRQES